MHRGCFVWTPTPPLSGWRTPRPGSARVCVCVPLLAGSGGPASRARFGAPPLFLLAGLRALFVSSAPCGRGLPCLWLLLVVFSFSLPCCAPLDSGVLCLLAPGDLGLGVLWSSGPPPPSFFFFSLCAPLSLLFLGFRPGLPSALAPCGAPARPSPLFFCFPPPPFFFLSACHALFFCLFPAFYFFFRLPSHFFAGCSVLWLVCVSWAVGCAGVCCCGRCVPAGAGFRLRRVVGCSLVVPVLCVLLPVVLRCCGVFCVLPTPTQEWEDEYAVNVTDMTAYVESVEDLEQDTILSLLAYHSWRWGHQVTLRRPQDGPHQWSPEQTAKWDIVLQLTPEGFYILTADYPTPHPMHRRCRWPSPRRTTQTHPARRNVIGTPPQPPPNACRAGSPNVTSPTTTMPPTTRGDAAHCPCSGHHLKAPSRGGESSPSPWRSRTCGSGTRRRTRSPPAHTSSSP